MVRAWFRRGLGTARHLARQLQKRRCELLGRRRRDGDQRSEAGISRTRIAIQSGDASMGRGTLALCSRNSKTGPNCRPQNPTLMCYPHNPRKMAWPRYALRLESPLSRSCFQHKGGQMKIMLVVSVACCAPLRPWRQRTFDRTFRRGVVLPAWLLYITNDQLQGAPCRRLLQTFRQRHESTATVYLNGTISSMPRRRRRHCQRNNAFVRYRARMPTACSNMEASMSE